MASSTSPSRPPTALSASAAAFAPTPTDTPKPTDGLSAAAPAFAPATNGYDAFAQTGTQQEDLFNEEFVPAEESLQTRAEDSLFDDDFVPVSVDVGAAGSHGSNNKGAKVVANGNRGRGGDARGRGRGRGRAGIQNQQQQQRQQLQARAVPQPNTATPTTQKPRRTGLESSKYADPAPQPPIDVIPQAELNNKPQEPQQESQQSDQPDTSQQPQQSPQAQQPPQPQQPNNTTRTTPSVRGDRRATGGNQRTKLTDSQLAEKMAAARIRSEKATAAHEKAEADRHAHAERESKAEQEAAQRRKADRQNRQQMMGEREKNRLRKLKAQTGREWDAEKNDEEMARDGGRGGDRGFGGDNADYTDGREYIYREDRRGRGRGGAGRGGGRGVGQSRSQTAPTRDDFPALPATEQNTSATAGAQSGAEDRNAEAAPARGLSTGAIASWADQVESVDPSSVG